MIKIFNIRKNDKRVVCIKSNDINFKIGHIYTIVDFDNGLTILGDNNKKSKPLANHFDSGIYDFNGSDELRFMSIKELRYWK